MTPEQFLSRCRGLWHVAPLGAWDRIDSHGLRTAQELIDGSNEPDDRRAELTDAPRREIVHLKVDEQEVALRDQEPLTRRRDLASLLGDDMTVPDWIRLLNRRVYLFVDQSAKARLVDKYVKLTGGQDVLVFSPRRLLDVAKDRIELADQNSGALARTASAYKLRDTFMPIARFPDKVPKEVTIVGGLSDEEVRHVVMRVDRVTTDGSKLVAP
jgi:hypothetical protein